MLPVWQQSYIIKNYWQSPCQTILGPLQDLQIQLYVTTLLRRPFPLKAEPQQQRATNSATFVLQLGCSTKNGPVCVFWMQCNNSSCAPPPEIPSRLGNRRPHTPRLKQESSLSNPPTPARICELCRVFRHPWQVLLPAATQEHQQQGRKKKNLLEGPMSVCEFIYEKCAAKSSTFETGLIWSKNKGIALWFSTSASNLTYTRALVFFVWNYNGNMHRTAHEEKLCPDIKTRRDAALYRLKDGALNEAVWLRLLLTRDEINESEPLVSIGIEAQHNLKSR